MRRTATTAAAFALVAALAGCGSNDQAPSTVSSSGTSKSTSTASPVPSLSATPTAISMKNAGEQYLGIVKPVNTALDAASKEVDKVIKTGGVPTKSQFPKLHRAFVRLADTNRAFSLALLSNEWPPKVQRTVDKLADQVAADQAELRALAKAKTPSKWVAAYNAYTPSNTPAAEVLRQQLGLSERG